jgi:hypothetical protein
MAKRYGKRKTAGTRIINITLRTHVTNAIQIFHGGLSGVIMRSATAVTEGSLVGISMFSTKEVYPIRFITTNHVADLLIHPNNYKLKARGAAREKSPKTSHCDHPSQIRFCSAAGENVASD